MGSAGGCEEREGEPEVADTKGETEECGLKSMPPARMKSKMKTL